MGIDLSEEIKVSEPNSEEKKRIFHPRVARPSEKTLYWDQ